MLGQDYPGASLDDVDPELLERALGRDAVDDLERAAPDRARAAANRATCSRTDGELTLTPQGMRRLGETALRRIFAQLHAARPRRPRHARRRRGRRADRRDAGQWQFGDEQPFDVVRTVRNAVLRSGAGTPVRIDVEDFEVVETERRSGAAVALLVDLSYSMALRGTWAAAKSTALALHSLVTTQYPQDAIEIIGFSRYARVLQPAESADVDAGTWCRAPTCSTR